MPNYDDSTETFAHLSDGEQITRGATPVDLFDELRRRVEKAQRDLIASMADVQLLASLLAQLADENRTVGQLPGPSVW